MCSFLLLQQCPACPVSVHVMHPYSRINTTAAWKKLCFSSDRSDFHMIDKLSIAVHTFTRHILQSISVDEILLPRYVNLSTNFLEPTFSVDVSFLIKTHVLRFVCIDMETNAAYCHLQTMQQGFGLGRCIYQKRNIPCVVCVCNSLCGVSSASCLFFFFM